MSMARNNDNNTQQGDMKAGEMHDLRTVDGTIPAVQNGTSDLSKPLIKRARRRSSISVAVADHPGVVELIICVAGIYTSL